MYDVFVYFFNIMIAIAHHKPFFPEFFLVMKCIELFIAFFNWV